MEIREKLNHQITSYILPVYTQLLWSSLANTLPEMRSRTWNCPSSTGKKIFLHFLLKGQPEYQGSCLVRCTVGSGGRIERELQVTEIKKKSTIIVGVPSLKKKKKCWSPGSEMTRRTCSRDRWHTWALRFCIKYTIDIHCSSVISNCF